jgi:small subunit ribosomal protein S17
MEENEEKIEETSIEAAGVPQGEPDSATSATSATSEASATAEPDATAAQARRRRLEKVGLVTSDKMTKTVVVRVERQVRHPKYKRYIRRRTKFMAHDDLGAHTGDIVRIVETRPLSARKRWRVVEIVQKAS